MTVKDLYSVYPYELLAALDQLSDQFVTTKLPNFTFIPSRFGLDFLGMERERSFHVFKIDPTGQRRWLRSSDTETQALLEAEHEHAYDPHSEIYVLNPNTGVVAAFRAARVHTSGMD